MQQSIHTIVILLVSRISTCLVCLEARRIHIRCIRNRNTEASNLTVGFKLPPQSSDSIWHPKSYAGCLCWTGQYIRMAWSQRVAVPPSLRCDTSWFTLMTNWLLLLQIRSFLGLTRVLALLALTPYLVRDNWKRQLPADAALCLTNKVMQQRTTSNCSLHRFLSHPKRLFYFFLLHCTHLETFITTSPPTIVTANRLAHTIDPEQPQQPTLTVHSFSPLNRPK